MAVVDLTRYFKQAGRDHARLLSRLLASGKGFEGQRLPTKDRPDGDPLGGSIRRRLRLGRVSSSRSGFRIDYRQDRLVVRFHRGRKGQEQRPIVGLSDRDSDSIEAGAAEEAAQQLQLILDRI